MKKQKDVVTLCLHRRSGTVIQEWVLDTVVTTKKDGTVVWNFPRKGVQRYTWTNPKAWPVCVAKATVGSALLASALPYHRCRLSRVPEVRVLPGGSVTLEFGHGEPVLIVR